MDVKDMNAGIEKEGGILESSPFLVVGSLILYLIWTRSAFQLYQLAPYPHGFRFTFTGRMD